MSEPFKGRVNLSVRAAEALTFMVQQLKEENNHVQVGQSSLCSWIVETYVREHFSKDTTRIVQAHFNPKRYLTEMLKQAKTAEDVRQILDGSMFRASKASTPAGRKTGARGIKSPEDVPPSSS